MVVLEARLRDGVVVVVKRDQRLPVLLKVLIVLCRLHKLSVELDQRLSINFIVINHYL